MPSPTGFSETTQKDFSYLGESNRRALLSGSKWGDTLGAGFTLTYSFPWTTRSDGMAAWDFVNVGGYTKNDTTNFNLSNEPYRAGATNLNATQQASVKDALSKWANVANVKFNYVAESSTQVGDLRFTFTATDGNEGGHAYLTSTTAKAGDIWLPSEQINTTFQNPEVGTYGYLTFLHEIGHALGLKHTFEGYSLPADQDRMDYSVMSYNIYVRSDDPEHLVEADFYPTTPMWYDIFAMQFLYGANNSYHTGDDVYTYRENEHYWESIWDAGGDDTINYIGSVSAEIDLRNGVYGSSDMGLDVSFSNNKSLRGTITILPGVVIENAYGGSGDDTLQGNGTNNDLDGRLGTDTAIFEGNKSDYKVQKVGDSYIVNSIAEGKDTLKNIEFLRFKDGTFAIDSVLTNNASSLVATDDYAGNITTTGILTVGSQVTGNIELANDEDWFKVYLQASATYSFELTGFDGGGGTLGSGTSPHQPYLNLYDTTGVWTTSAYNGGSGGDPLMSFTPTVSGNYYLGAEDLFTTGTGTYTLKAKASITNHAPTGYVYISGETQQGQTLTASNLLADLDGIGAISYQWLSNSNVISGANQSTYTLNAADVGKAISVKASYVDLKNTAESVTSNATSPILAPVNHAPTGSAVGFGAGDEDSNYALTPTGLLNGFSDADGDKLSVTNLTVINGKITTNTDGTWLLTPDANFNGTVQLNYTVSDNKGGATNAVINFVLNPVNDAPTGYVYLSGETQQGKTLTASNSLTDLDGLGVINYQWLSNGTVVSNQLSYTLTQNDVGKNISVTASYIDGLGKLENVTSSAVKIANVNDMPTGLVLISGEIQQGKTLTISNSLADADGLGAISYQWLSGGNVISGANQATYTLTATDVGKAISVKASYTDLQGTAESIVSSPTLSITPPANFPPTGNVSIAGETIRGKTLSIMNTLADANGLGSFMYQWFRGLNDSDAINGATQSTYTLTAEDVDKKISVVVGYIDGLGKQEGMFSDETVFVVLPTNYPSTGNVTISGTASQNQTLTVSNNLADANGLGVINYQWLSNGTVISNQLSYALTQNDVGKNISVIGSYTDSLGKLESVISTSVTVSNVNDAPTGSVTIFGTTTQGQILTVSNSLADLDGLGWISYQWLNSGSPISGATQHSYTLTATDVGKNISVKASYIDLQNTPESVTSNATTAIQKLAVVEPQKPVISTKRSSGNDLLTGTVKGEKLSPLAGNDTLIGGLGSDTLTGGNGADVFKFNNVKETGVTATIRDKITDFKHSEKDKIDLSAIDANEKAAGDQAFTFIVSIAFSKINATGQLRFDATNKILYGSTDADTAPEFSIQLNGVSSLLASDFVL